MAGCSSRWAARWSSASSAPGEQLHVDTGCLAAYTPGVDFDLVSAGGVRSALFGGEGLFFARLTGPGQVWIQSLPFSRLAGPHARGRRQPRRPESRRGIGARRPGRPDRRQ